MWKFQVQGSSEFVESYCLFHFPVYSFLYFWFTHFYPVLVLFASLSFHLFVCIHTQLIMMHHVDGWQCDSWVLESWEVESVCIRWSSIVFQFYSVFCIHFSVYYIVTLTLCCLCIMSCSIHLQDLICFHFQSAWAMQLSWTWISFGQMGGTDCKEGLELGHLVSLMQSCYTHSWWLISMQVKFTLLVIFCWDNPSSLNWSHSTVIIKHWSTSFMFTANFMEELEFLKSIGLVQNVASMQWPWICLVIHSRTSLFNVSFDSASKPSYS